MRKIKFAKIQLKMCFILSLIILFLFKLNVYADNYENEVNIEEIEKDTRQIIEETNGYFNEEDFSQNVALKERKEPIINARKYAIYDRGSKRIIYGKNNNIKCAMASTTKIMTAIIAIENNNISLDGETIVSQRAASVGGSRLGLKKGDKITNKELLYGLMLKSGNDAAIAIAEEIGGSVEGFVKMMNNKAQDLDLNNTHFVTPHGLDNPEHYTTATELAILTDYALSNQLFKEIVSTKTYTIRINGNPITINNTNELLGVLNGVVGVKTGFTNGAGRCLVTETVRGKRDLIVIVLGADTKKDRTRDSIRLIEYGFSEFKELDIDNEVKDLFEEWKQINIKRIKIDKAKESEVSLYLSSISQKTLLVESNKSESLEYEIISLTHIKAPIYNDQKLGVIMIKYDGEIIDQVDILVKNEIKKKNWMDFYIEICQLILRKKTSAVFM